MIHSTLRSLGFALGAALASTPAAALSVDGFFVDPSGPEISGVGDVLFGFSAPEAFELADDGSDPDLLAIIAADLSASPAPLFAFDLDVSYGSGLTDFLLGEFVAFKIAEDEIGLLYSVVDDSTGAFGSDVIVHASFDPGTFTPGGFPGLLNDAQSTTATFTISAASDGPGTTPIPLPGAALLLPAGLAALAFASRKRSAA